MTSRTEWEEYFELINNRKPNADEVTNALKKGEFEDSPKKETKAANPYVSKVKESVKEDHREAQAVQPTNQKVEEGKRQASETINKAKQHAGNYFSWFKVRALHPTQYVNESNPNNVYLWISFTLTTILSAGIFWNIVRRIFDTLYTYATSYSQSAAINFSTYAGRVVPSVFFDFVVIFLIIFLAALPGLALVSRGKESFKSLVSKYLVFQPAASLFSFAGFIYSFIAQIPNISSVSQLSNAMQQILVNIGILIVLPMLTIMITNLAAIYLVQKYRENDTKFDLIWWQITQAIITLIVIYIGYILIVTPMFQSLIDTISNFRY